MTLLGQSYIDSTSEWRIYEYEWGGGGPDKHIYEEYIYSKDTLIGEFEYHELSYEWTYMLIWENTRDTAQFSSFQAKVYVREDGKKIYERKEEGEALIYDFSYEIGDTIYYDLEHQEYYIIAKVEEFTIAGETREKYTTEPLHSGEFIIYEGIGTSRDFLSPFRDASFEGRRNLECYNYKGETLLISPMAENCEIEVLTSLGNLKRDGLIKIYPNPVSESVKIETEGINKIEDLELYDSRGNMINRGLFDTKRQIDGGYEIEVSKLVKGLYYIKLWLGDKYVIRKLIKL